MVHPRKEDIGETLTITSISGTAKASQEADNVLILQSTDEKSIDVTKNRLVVEKKGQFLIYFSQNQTKQMQENMKSLH